MSNEKVKHHHKKKRRLNHDRLGVSNKLDPSYINANYRNC